MSEFSLSKLWEREEGAMESCYKLYTWINHTLLMLLLQIFWKMSQISDYFKEKRGMIQRCGHKLPPIKSFISLGGQHQGVYGLPHCMAVSHKTCDYIRELLNYAAYQRWLQLSLVQATYWHDPLSEEEYKRKSIFLADINNELTINETYRSNLQKLESFVMVKFDRDSMVQPRESEWFGFYKPGQASQLQTLQQSKIYTEDRLGLQAMDRAGKLAFLSQPGDHLQFDETWFIDNIINKYLV
ncbi:palmitoyl-protein thioesterase 1-like isoform X2 [Leguminivora glycinivorella]|uniref:palmitoyl-protein thioesterase 1-like isoform X2 n=1 Tax=Leguminivora glycinivorella TaxID=1035111 RepID=UPI00200E4D8B|nr:palmitoyl-protein thioesterase 1-like isoform X2 [Leguminivora glycinivorella]